MTRPRPRKAASAMGPALEIAIENLAFGGSGVGRTTHLDETRAVFVPRTAPGDRVVCEVDWSTRPARGTVLRLLERSAARQAPPCAIADVCGGCDWMHLGQEARLDGYRGFFANAIPTPFVATDKTVHPAEGQLGYRTRARVAIDAGRRGLELGYRQRESREIVGTTRCPVLDPALEPVLAILGELFEGASGRGEANVALGPMAADDAGERLPVVDVEFDGSLPPTFFARAEAAIREKRLAGVRALERDATRPVTIGDPSAWVRGTDGPLRVAGFSQAHERGTLSLVDHVTALARGALAGKTKPTIVELYAGSGTFTVQLAKLVPPGAIVAVEADQAACDAARENLAARGLSAKLVTGGAERFPIPRNTTLVVLDPPRTGAREATLGLARSRPEAIVYVSCDPPTLGRDLEILADAGYRLAALDLFELFPQTSHVETVAHLVRERRA